MLHGQDGVVQEHPWSRVAHDGPDLLALCRTVAVDGAFGTGRLGFLKGTPIETGQCVLEECLAGWT